MRCIRFAGLLSALLVAAPTVAQDPKPAEGVPAPTNIRARSSRASMTTCA